MISNTWNRPDCNMKTMLMTSQGVRKKIGILEALQFSIEWENSICLRRSQERIKSSSTFKLNSTTNTKYNRTLKVLSEMAKQLGGLSNSVIMKFHSSDLFSNKCMSSPIELKLDHEWSQIKTQGEAVFEEGSEKEPWAAAQKPIQRGAFTASSVAEHFGTGRCCLFI